MRLGKRERAEARAMACKQAIADKRQARDRANSLTPDLSIKTVWDRIFMPVGKPSRQWGFDGKLNRTRKAIVVK